MEGIPDVVFYWQAFEAAVGQNLLAGELQNLRPSSLMLCCCCEAQNLVLCSF